MNIDHLKLFVRVSSLCNISQAGEELSLSPAVASAYLNKLEKSLGTRLLHRTTRHVSLTEDGAAFIPYAEDVLASAEAAQCAVGIGHNSPRGTLRITAPASFGRMHLMPKISGFMRANPDLNIDCRFSDTIVDMVEGGFDIAIRNAELKSSSFIARKLSSDGRIICASPQYIKEFGSPKSPLELQLHQCLTLVGLDNWQFETPSGVVSIKVKGKFRTDNGEALRDACCQGLGIAISSRWSVFEEMKNGKLIQILQEFPIISNMDIWMI